MRRALKSFTEMTRNSAVFGLFLITVICIPSALNGGAANPLPSAIHLVPQASPILASYFGMHIHNASTSTPWPSVPIASWRMWDAHVAWPDIEGHEGKWSFEKLDTYLKIAQEHKVQVLLPLGLSPKWASVRPEERSMYQPGFAAEPRNLDDWDNYVRAVVEHCKGRVEAYEIWNEPNLKPFWTGRTEQIIDMTRHAYNIIKSIDPKALVVSPSATTSGNGNDWLVEFLKSGGGKYVDVIGFHFYSETPEAMVQKITQVRQTMLLYHADSLPLWNTETGWAKPKPFPSAELGAAYLARAYLLAWAAGVQRFFWYAWDNHGFVSVEMTSADSNTLTPAGQAFGTIQSWLVGAQMKSCDMAPDHTWVCTLHRASGDEWVVWNPDHGTQMALPSSWHATTTTLLNASPVALNATSVRVTEIPQRILSAQRP